MDNGYGYGQIDNTHANVPVQIDIHVNIPKGILCMQFIRIS